MTLGSSPVLYGRGGAHREAMGGEGLYFGVGKTLTPQASGLGPPSPVKDGRGIQNVSLIPAVTIRPVLA